MLVSTVDKPAYRQLGLMDNRLELVDNRLVVVPDRLPVAELVETKRYQ